MIEKMREEFESWYVRNADFLANPIGSRECNLQWVAWQKGSQAYIKMTTQNFVTLPREAVNSWLLKAEWAGRRDLADSIRQALTEQVQPAQGERNFCERCGKRAYDGIHTCTPPQSKPTETA